MNTSRDIFFSTCQKIAVYFESHGFRAIEKCQRLKKTSIDKDLTFEIYFQSSVMNKKECVAFIPQVHIFSKKVKEQTREKTKNPHEKGYIGGGNIGNISNLKKWTEWTITPKNQDRVVKEVIKMLEKFALPLFARFESNKKDF